MKFLNPNYLFGLILIAVPIIIHLIFRKKLQKFPFSSLMFLKSAEASRLRWLRLKEILILLMRCLFVASLFLALARPQYQGRIFRGSRLAAVYLVIDNSLSMNYGKNFKAALDQAEKIITAYSSKSMFYVIPLCVQNDYKPFWSNRISALNRIKEIRLSNSTGSIKDLYEKFAREKTELPAEFVYIGDGQTINFRGLETVNNFYWIKIPLGSNVAIEYVELKNPYSIPTDNYEMKVKIKNYSGGSYQGKVQVIAGSLFQQKEYNIPPMQDLITVFSLPVNIQNGVVKIDNDSLPVDNQYYFSKSLLFRINVLVVGNGKYIKLVLSPSTTIKTPFKIEHTTDLKKVNLGPHQIILLNGIEEITEFERLKLLNFLTQSRNGLIICLGPKTGPQLKNFLTDCGDIKGLVNIDGYLNIKWYDTDYPPFYVFQDNPGLKTIKFFRLCQMIPRGRVLALLNNDMPLIINHNNLTVLTTELNESSTDLIYNPNFVPLLHSLIYGLTNKHIDNEFRIGDRVLRPDLIRDPDGEILSDSILSKIGFYTVSKETLAVNIDPVESNPATITPQMADNLGIKTITIESLKGPADMSTSFLIIALCAFVCELLFLLL